MMRTTPRFDLNWLGISVRRLFGVIEQLNYSRVLLLGAARGASQRPRA